jgi:hypothetical protein
MGIEFFRGKEQSLGKKWEIHDDLLSVIFVKPLRFGEGYFNLRGGGGKIST